MTRPGKPPRFVPWAPPRVKPPQSGDGYRPSSYERGYDWKWQKFSRKFRKANPWCRFCQQEGRDEPGMEVDHILPVEEYPELKFSWPNCENLCRFHHGVTKQKLEAYARKHNCLDKLTEWCADPRTRPDELKPFGDLNFKDDRGD